MRVEEDEGWGGCGCGAGSRKRAAVPLQPPPSLFLLSSLLSLDLFEFFIRSSFGGLFLPFGPWG